MRLWQRTMIRLALSSRTTAFMHRRAALSALARRFVGGADLAEAIETCRTLRADGIRASLFHLGEYVSDPDLVARTVTAKIAAARGLGAAGLDVHVSVDPTQIGHLIDPAVLEGNARTIGEAVRTAAAGKAAPGVDLLMLDMEDATLVDPTIALYRDLSEAGLPAGLTLQAYLLRTAADLEALLPLGGAIRIVKGAFAAGPDVAHTDRDAIRDAFLRLAARTLSPEARAAGLYPSFATHDDALIDRIVAGPARDVDPDAWEIEMLHGVRPDLQRALARRGLRVRAYVPFGAAWWPYAARRIGETPKNALLLLRGLPGRS